MFWFKSCPRCGGDLFSDRDIHGPYIACLQCSHELTEAQKNGLMSRRLGPRIRRVAAVEKVQAAA